MTRMFLGGLAAGGLVVAANLAAGTWWAPWFAVAALLAVAVVCLFEGRLQRDLVLSERERRDRGAA